MKTVGRGRKKNKVKTHAPTFPNLTPKVRIPVRVENVRNGIDVTEVSVSAVVTALPRLQGLRISTFAAETILAAHATGASASPFAPASAKAALAALGAAPLHSVPMSLRETCSAKAAVVELETESGRERERRERRASSLGVGVGVGAVAAMRGGELDFDEEDDDGVGGRINIAEKLFGWLDLVSCHTGTATRRVVSLGGTGLEGAKAMKIDQRDSLSTTCFSYASTTAQATR